MSTISSIVVPGSPSFTLSVAAMDISDLKDAESEIEVHSRPGMDGVALRDIGKKPVPCRVTFVGDALGLSAAQAKTREVRNKMRGKLVTVNHHSGQTWTRMVCRDVTFHQIQTTPCMSGAVNSASTAFFVGTAHLLHVGD